MEYSKEELLEKLVRCEQEKAELEFRVEELNDFIENAAMPLHWVDGNGIILWANRAELDSLGLLKKGTLGFLSASFMLTSM